MRSPQAVELEEHLAEQPVLVPELCCGTRQEVCSFVEGQCGPVHHEGDVVVQAQVHDFDGEGLELWDLRLAWGRLGLLVARGRQGENPPEDENTAYVVQPKKESALAHQAGEGDKEHPDAEQLHE